MATRNIQALNEHKGAFGPVWKMVGLFVWGLMVENQRLMIPLFSGFIRLS
jgi:hypothetical protein